jgi:Ca2+-binding RTX toxin-like protein
MATYTNPKGSNVLGTAGADSFLFDAGFGDAVVRGRGGHDSVVIDRISEAATIFQVSAGIRTLSGSAATAPDQPGIDFSEMEKLTITGGSAADRFVLKLWRPGADVEVGFDGGGGADLLQLDASDNLAPLSFTVNGRAVATGFGTFTNFERFEIVGTEGDDVVRTGAGADLIEGGEGDDQLGGGGGNDRLDGGVGADAMAGGAGNDVYWIDNLQDKVAEAANGGNDQVLSSISYTLGRGVERLTLEGWGDLGATGNGLDNVLIGNGHDNLLDGRAGADRMSGGYGADTYVVDNAGDTVLETHLDGYEDTVRARIDYTLAANVENLLLIGSAAIGGAGNRLFNLIIGNAAGNSLSGLGGGDRLLGKGGDDVLAGGDGSDHLVGGRGADRFVFDTALDRLDLDEIFDFRASDDSIVLDRSVFRSLAAGDALAEGAFHLGTAAGDANDRILYDQASGEIFYDPDGSGDRPAMLFAELADGTALTHADFILVA